MGRATGPKGHGRTTPMYRIPFLDLPPLHAWRHGQLCPAPRASPTACCCWPHCARARTTVHDLLDSDDTRVMLDALRQLGCTVEEDGAQVHITGLGGRAPHSPAQLFLGNAGTAMRPLTAALALLGGDFELQRRAAHARAPHRRPGGRAAPTRAARSTTWATRAIRRCASAHARCTAPEARRTDPRARRRVQPVPHRAADGAAAGQRAAQDVVIEVVGELISKPYIDITLQACWRALALQCNATAGSVSPSRQAAATNRPATSMWRQTPRLLAIS
jgi:3-phosphoshikimate 1-carboxyvinyltransferase